jgi:uncharacterized protein (DUF2235 family)
MSQHQLQEPIASTSDSRYTLVVCFDAETTDLTKNSTIIQLCNSIKNTDRTLVYYAVRSSCSYISSGLTILQSPTTIKSVLKSNSILDYIAHHLSPASIVADLVMSAYRFLMQNCRVCLKPLQYFGLLTSPTDSDASAPNICIFGSSRGALAARVLAGMLHSVCYIYSLTHLCSVCSSVMIFKI